MKTMISREYWFSAAHRIEGHSKCGRLHGHNYRVEVTVEGPIVNGMVIDYGELDRIVKPFIDGVLDHRYIVSVSNLAAGDPYLQHGVQAHMAVLLISESTAEKLADWLGSEIQKLLPAPVRVVSILVEETPKSKAVVTYDLSK